MGSYRNLFEEILNSTNILRNVGISILIFLPPARWCTSQTKYKVQCKRLLSQTTFELTTIARYDFHHFQWNMYKHFVSAGFSKDLEYMGIQKVVTQSQMYMYLDIDMYISKYTQISSILVTHQIFCQIQILNRL